MLSYVEAFDPDLLVQFSRQVPPFLTETRLKVVKAGEVWQNLGGASGRSPQFGIGIFELSDYIFDEYFKYRTKYPVKVALPRIPRRLSAFWASIFGEMPSEVMTLLERNYKEPLEIERPEASTAFLREAMQSVVLFPVRIGRIGLNQFRRSHPFGDAIVYFMDASRPEDVVDFWNLRALGKDVLALPKQLREEAELSSAVASFLKYHRKHMSHDSKICTHAMIIKSRASTVQELDEYAKAIRIERDPNDPSVDPFFGLQHWYPRIWDDWAAYPDAAVPDDIYGEKQESGVRHICEVRHGDSPNSRRSRGSGWRIEVRGWHWPLGWSRTFPSP